ncbi:MAG: hypothetical protein E7645_03575 [Ruminococcaceae bacterium]|nr:hypothetical protein [Oscillospiraceae bacterium]
MSAPIYDTHPEAWHGIDPAYFEVKIKGLKRDYTFFHLTDLHMGEMTPAEAAEMSEERRSYAQHRFAFFAREGQGAAALWNDYITCAKVEGADLLLLTGDIIDFPSEANIKALKDGVQNSVIPTLYVVGNHDWSFADDYHTSNAAARHFPKFSDLCNGNPHICWVEYEDLIVCAVDDTLDRVTKETVDEFMRLCDLRKPIILMMHVPLYVASMEDDCMASWHNLLMVGGKAYHGEDPYVKRFYEAVALDPHTPVKLVVTGHLHFHHEDIFPNGTPQIVTDKGYTGGCRVIRVLAE